MINRDEFERLYNQGLNTSQMAEALGANRPQLTTWMRAHGYPTICPENQKIAREMHSAGATDLEIAMRINCVTSVVLFWRERNGLRKNPRQRRGRHRKEVVIV